MRGILVALFLALASQTTAADPPPNSSFTAEDETHKSPKEQPAQSPVAEQTAIDSNSPPPTSLTKDNEPANNSLFLGDGFAQWLMAVTGVIAALISGWAVWLLRGTLVATNRTAEAASENTRAMIGAERPHVRLFRTIKQVDKSGKVIAVDGVNFRNVGRTPALVKSLAIEYVLAKTPPLPSECRRIRSFPDDSVMAQRDEEWPRKHYVPPMDGETKLNELLPGHGKDGFRLFVYGEVVYSDAFGEERKTGFCRVFTGREFTYNQSDINENRLLNYAT